MSAQNEARGSAPAGAHLDENRLRDLMVFYQNADGAAVEELIDALSPLLARFLWRPGLNPGEVEDMLQDCWLRIHRARHTYRASEPLLPWIFAIARHTRLDAFRRRQRRAVREVLVANPPEPRAPGASRTDVLALVERLPSGQRDAIVMLKVIGMSLADVARATASTPGAIKQKAHRAYEALRRMLEEKP